MAVFPGTENLRAFLVPTTNVLTSATFYVWHLRLNNIAHRAQGYLSNNSSEARQWGLVRETTMLEKHLGEFNCPSLRIWCLKQQQWCLVHLVWVSCSSWNVVLQRAVHTTTQLTFTHFSKALLPPNCWSNFSRWDNSRKGWQGPSWTQQIQRRGGRHHARL